MAGLKDAYALPNALAGTGILVGILSVVFDRRRLGKDAQTAGAA